MIDGRHCAVYPTCRGWFLEYTNLPDGRREDALIYGPLPALREILLFLGQGFLVQSTQLHRGRHIRDVPLVSPAGGPVRPARLTTLAPWYGAPADRFIGTPQALYDTALDIEFHMNMIGAPTIRQVRGAYFWEFVDLAGEESLPIPDGVDEWLTLSRSLARRAIKAGRSYQPIILPGLPRQPKSRLYLT
jgi:hypothetical protein